MVGFCLKPNVFEKSPFFVSFFLKKKIWFRPFASFSEKEDFRIK